MTIIRHPDQIQFVYYLKCGCRLNADEFFIAETNIDCDIVNNITVSFTPKYLANLPYLTSFINDKSLQALRGDVLFNQSLNVQLPPLAVASKRYKAKLGLEKQSAYEMETAINQTKADAVMFSDLSHYLYNILLSAHTHSKSFDWFNVYDWLLVLATASGLLALLLVLILHYKVRSLILLLASSGQAHAHIDNDYEAFTLPTLFYMKTTTPYPTSTMDYLYYHRMVQRLFPVDLTLLLILILSVFIFFGYLYFKYRKSRYYRTTLVLEIANTDTAMTWLVTRLPYNPGSYRFTIDRQVSNVRLVESYIGATISWGSGVTVFNVSLDLSVSIPVRVAVWPWQLRRLRKLMQTTHFAALHVLAVNNDLSEVIVIRAFRPPEPVGSSVGLEQGIYPVRELRALQP